MINVFEETVLTIDQAAAMLPGTRGAMCRGTIRRAINRGDLEFAKVGGRVVTSQEAIQRWIDRETVSAIDKVAPKAPLVRPVLTKSRERHLDAIAKRLAAEGV